MARWSSSIRAWRRYCRIVDTPPPRWTSRPPAARGNRLENRDICWLHSARPWFALGGLLSRLVASGHSDGHTKKRPARESHLDVVLCCARRRWPVAPEQPSSSPPALADLAAGVTCAAPGQQNARYQITAGLTLTQAWAIDSDVGQYPRQRAGNEPFLSMSCANGCENPPVPSTGLKLSACSMALMALVIGCGIE